MCPFTIKVPNPRYRGLNYREKIRLANQIFHIDYLPDEYVSVPCGHCPYCLRRKRTEYRIKLANEASLHSKVLFLTLSIAPRYYKDSSSQISLYVRNFLDNLRKKRRLHRGKFVKHWFISEGSEKEYSDHRLHLHGFLFGITKKDLTYKEIRHCWKYGFVWIRQAELKTINYTTKYITKDSSVPQRIFTSKGLGLSASDTLFFDEFTYSYKGNTFIPNRCKAYHIPRYLKNRLRIPLERLCRVLLARFESGFFVEKYYYQGNTYKSLSDFRAASSSARSDSLRNELFYKWFQFKPFYKHTFSII